MPGGGGTTVNIPTSGPARGSPGAGFNAPPADRGAARPFPPVLVRAERHRMCQRIPERHRPTVAVAAAAAVLAAACAFGGVKAVAPAAAAAAPTAGTAPAVPPASRPTGARSLARVIRFLEDRVRRDPEDTTALNRLSGEYLRRFRDSGDDGDLALAAQAADQSVKAVPADFNKGGLAARARAAFALHRFAAARDDARRLVDLDPGKAYAYGLLGDALLELGDLGPAADAYAKMRSAGEDEPADPTVPWRTARLALARGDLEGAKQGMAATVAAARELSPPNPPVLAWAHVQAGQFAFSTGDWAAAEDHYRTALTAVPDDWPALDHLAELRAAQRRYDEAINTYERLVARVPRPELVQALGDVCKAAGRADAAAAWYGRAREKYLAAAEAGSAHYHHLAGFYSDAMPNPAEAVKWARRDLEVRRSAAAHDALAWALFQAGEFTEAAAAMDRALATRTRDSHVLYHASLVYFRAGDPARGRDCLRRAGEANPKFTEFHVHR